MSSGTYGFPQRRGAAAVVLGLFVAGGLVIIFAGTLARATELEEQAAIVRAETAALEERLAAGVEEVASLKERALLAQEARAIGWGEQGEIPFSLPGDATSPEPIVPLGSESSGAAPVEPLDAWLELLFGD
jgi:cell division protein FtsB